MNKRKGSLVQRELSPKVTEGLFFGRILLFTIPPSCFASHLPLHKGGSLPPDSSPERCNTLHLAGKACEKEYEQSSVLLLIFSVGKNLLFGRYHLGAPFVNFLCLRLRKFRYRLQSSTYRLPLAHRLGDTYILRFGRPFHLQSHRLQFPLSCKNQVQQP